MRTEWSAGRGSVGGDKDDVLMLDDGVPEPLAEPPPNQVEHVAALIDALLSDERSPSAVTKFYDPTTTYAGDTFLGLAPNEPYAIGTADLLAVTLLDVNPGVAAARALLPGGKLANQTSALLARIPLGVAVWEATDDDLAWSGSLWSLLRNVDGVGRTIAGKLMARKRPELIPIVDDVVHGRLGCLTGTYWTTFRRVLQDPSRRARIASLAPHVPALRVLDTLMWMHWRKHGLS
ncbi:DUF6308 family protein [Micromonospora aurantiaca (nom. illeg.)]|uniref:DUF6308 family protein n=1 Tax=Micromonospora aurantiaca (nom. illeg.) TaxID=47850 RepID=UPI003EB7BED4